MGIVSLNDLDRLYWAGRYGERALRVYLHYTALPSAENVRRDFAERLCVSEPAVHPDESVLCTGGVVYESLLRWHDNAVQLRHLLTGSAVRQAEALLLAWEKDGLPEELPTRLYAFFAIADDALLDSVTRSAVRAGRMVERLDICSRLGEPAYALEDALHRLTEAMGESDAAQALISRCQKELAERDLAHGNVAAVQLRTPYMENVHELS